MHINVITAPSSRMLWHAWQHTGWEPGLYSVYEDRVDEERRASRQPRRGGGEVAGLEDVDDSSAATVTSSVPGAGGIRSHRRTRPLSLAVQPLNYHRLDPDPRPPAQIATRHHPNMTSQESIGSCSLDVDRSASDRSGWLSRIERYVIHTITWHITDKRRQSSSYCPEAFISWLKYFYFFKLSSQRSVPRLAYHWDKMSERKDSRRG